MHQPSAKKIMYLLWCVPFLFCFGPKPHFSNDVDVSKWFAYHSNDATATGSIGMRDWLDKPAGKYGFVQMRGDKFVLENGTSIKFWGVNIADSRVYVDQAKAKQWTAYLAKYGVNAVRMHKFTWDGVTDQYSTQMKASQFDKLDYFHQQLAESGIYVGWSHIFGHKVKPGDSSRMLAYQEIARLGSGFLSGSTYSLVNFFPDLQDLHIELSVNMLNHRNEYTGKRYADDPALAFVEMQNEDNGFFASAHARLQQTPTYRKDLCARFSVWLMEKYGNERSWRAAWGADFIEDSVSFEKKNVYPMPHHGVFQQAYEQAVNQHIAMPRAHLDRMHFIYQLQKDYYTRMENAIRNTGYQGVLIGSSWQAGAGPSHYYNLHADYQIGAIDRHNYFGGGAGHDLSEKESVVNNFAMVKQPGSGLFSTGMQQVKDRPFILSEWMSLPPNEWLAEAPAIIGMYGMGLQGWDGSFAYASNLTHPTNTLTSPNHGIYNADVPTHISLYPWLARMIYRNDIQMGEIIHTRKVHVPSLKEGKLGFYEVVEQEYDVKYFTGDAPAEALAIGRPVVSFSDQYEATSPPALEKWWNKEKQLIHSTTDELTWYYGEKAYFTLNTAASKAVVGFAGDMTHQLGNVKISTNNPFACIMLTAKNQGETLADAKSILLVAIARARNTGMQYSPDHLHLVEKGEAPLLIEPVALNIGIKREGKPTLHLLDHDGKRTGETVEMTDAKFSLDGAETKTMFYEITYP